MANFKKYGLTGVAGTIELGKGGAKWYNNSGVLEATNNAENALAIVRAANAVGDTDVVTLGQMKDYVQSYGVPKIYGYIYDGGSTTPASVEFTSSAQEGLLAVAIETVGSFTVKKLYKLVTWTTDVATSTWTEITPLESMTIATRVASLEKTISFSADHLYMYDTQGTAWIDIGPVAPTVVTTVMKSFRSTLAFGTSSPVTLGNLPINAIVRSIAIVVATPFNGTAPTLSIGVSGTVGKYMAAAEIDLKTAGTYITDLGILEASAVDAIATYVADTSSAGSALIIMDYDIV